MALCGAATKTKKDEEEKEVEKRRYESLAFHGGSIQYHAKNVDNI